MLCGGRRPYPGLTHPAKLNPVWTLRVSLFICVPEQLCVKGENHKSEPGGSWSSTVQYGSHQPHVASECLKWAQCDGGTELFIAFNFDYLKFKQTHMACGCHMTA